MPSAAQSVLPGVGFAELCIARCRAMFKRDEIRDPARLSAGEFLWECAFNERDRRFLCLIARAPRELAARDWKELTRGEQFRLTAGLFDLLRWIGAHQRAIDALRRERAA